MNPLTDGDRGKTTSVFEDFEGMGDFKGTKPVMLYFHLPEEDADMDDKDIANQVRRCKLMDELLEEEIVRRASVLFHCLKCNINDLSEELKKKYKLKLVPKVLFFDVRGKKVWQLTSTKAKPEGIAKKMVRIAAVCKKLVERMKK